MTLDPEGSVVGLVFEPRKCVDCAVADASWSADGARCHACWVAYADREQGDHWADHLLRRAETDDAFRERLRAVLGAPATIRDPVVDPICPQCGHWRYLVRETYLTAPPTVYLACRCGWRQKQVAP